MKSINGIKKCSLCHKEKPVSEYHKHKGTSDGLDNWCNI